MIHKFYLKQLNFEVHKSYVGTTRGIILYWCGLQEWVLYNHIDIFTIIQSIITKTKQQNLLVVSIGFISYVSIYKCP